MRETEKGVELQIKVIPKASQSALVGWEGNVLKVRLAAVPEKGRANEELIAFLSEVLHLPKSQIECIRGEKSRHKCVLLRGVSAADVQQRLSGASWPFR